MFRKKTKTKKNEVCWHPVLFCSQTDQMEDYKKGTHLRSTDKIRQLVGGHIEGNIRTRPQNPEKRECDAEAKRKKPNVSDPPYPS